MPSAELIHLSSSRMSEADYDRERARIRETYGESRGEAANRWEQALAVLFFRSGWTQEQLAAKEGKGQQWVSRRLIFGRFMAFLANTPDGVNAQNLSEGGFRALWEQTEGSDERRRFREVKRLMEENPEQRKAISRAITETVREHYTDGKWHSVEAIANRAEQPEGDVLRVLNNMASNAGSYRYNVEKRKFGRGYQFRLFSKTGKTIGSDELVEKLSPLIQRLRSQAKTNMATVAIGVFGEVAHELQALLDEWRR